jgi:glycerol-3-phosphate acyltransferase PlsY
MSMILLSILAGYLIGSIPMAWIVTKLVTGRDLRDVGSGNVGVMNVALSVARWAGLIVFLFEALKGVLAVILARQLIGTELGIGLTVIAAVAGTRWPIWLGFAGGRGNTVGVAAVLLLSWPTVVLGAVLWFTLRLIFRTHFIATRGTLLLWPFLFWGLTQSIWFGGMGAVLSLLYLTTHQTGTDDHLIIKERWPSLWAFLIGPRRR